MMHIVETMNHKKCKRLHTCTHLNVRVQACITPESRVFFGKAWETVCIIMLSQVYITLGLPPNTNHSDELVMNHTGISHFVGSCLATKVFIGKLPAVGWV